MNDKQVIKQLNNSRVEQELRDHLTNKENSQIFENLEKGESNGTEMHKKVFDEYKSKSRNEQQSFTKKQWINE
jgi:hypothetical protein